MRREGGFLQCNHTGEKKSKAGTKTQKETQKTKKNRAQLSKISGERKNAIL